MFFPFGRKLHYHCNWGKLVWREVLGQGNLFPLRVQIFGRFTIFDASGTEIPLASPKLMALVALLVCDRAMTRKRDWIASILWSRNESAHALSSLRQALPRLRKELGPAQDVLISNRNEIRFDPAKIIAIGTPAEGAFLEDVFVKEPPFQEWCRLHAQKGNPESYDKPPVTAKLPAKTKQKTFLITKVQSQRPNQGWAFEDIVTNAMSRLLRERNVVTISNRMPENAGPHDRILEVTVSARIEERRSISLSAMLHDIQTGEQLWSDDCSGALPSGPLSHNVLCLGLSHRIADTVISQIIDKNSRTQSRSISVDGYLSTAIRCLFSMTPEGFDRAERILNEMDPTGETHAWQAQLAVIRFIERAQGNMDAQSLKDLAKYHICHAMELSPFHSDVLAAVSNTHLVFEANATASMELSDIAVRTNKANPLAWWARSNALLYAGESEKAYVSAVFAQKLTDRTSLKFWGDIQRALCAAATSRRDEAAYYAQASHSFKSTFRPPLRYMLGLQSMLGDERATLSVAEALSQVEPDFSIDRFLEDPDYPISMMRSRNLLNRALLKGIS